jgi:exonuclease SbcD
MRILHLADLHLGKVFYDVHLTDAQAILLDQVVDLAKAEKVDVVVVAGDVYDRSIPPVEATNLLDEFLSRLVVDLGVKVVLIPGNHDSAERLAFGRRLLDSRGLWIASAPAGGIMPVVIADPEGEVIFHPVPFCDPVQVRREIDDKEIVDFNSAHRYLLSKVTAPGKRSVCIAHCFTQGGRTSESERELSIGGAAFVDPSIFSAYSLVLLGHLHRPQEVAKNGWYAGTPFPYSFSELDHEKTVAIHELAKDGSVKRELFRLSPRHNLRKLEGTFDDILHRAKTDKATGDYVWIALADREAAFEQSRRLREVYPNALHITRSLGMGDSVEIAPRADAKQRRPREIVDDFFAAVADEALNADEAREVDSVLAQAQHDLNEAGDA